MHLLPIVATIIILATSVVCQLYIGSIAKASRVAAPCSTVLVLILIEMWYGFQSLSTCVVFAAVIYFLSYIGAYLASTFPLPYAWRNSAARHDATHDIEGEDRLSLLSRRDDRPAFVRALGETDILLLAALTNEGWDAATFSPEDMLAEARKARLDVTGCDTFAPFFYERDGVEAMPFFSTVDHVETFCEKFSKERNRVFPFQRVNAAGSVIASALAWCPILVLNAKSAEEYVLSSEDARLLVEIWGRDRAENADDAPMTVEQLIRQFRNAPMGQSIGPVTKALAAQSVWVGTEGVTPTRDGKIVGKMCLKTGADNQGRAWVYAYTSRAEFSKAFPDGGPFAEMSFPDLFELVDKDQQFAGLVLNSTSDAMCPIPRELFGHVRQALPKK